MKTLESRMLGNLQVRFGGGWLEKQVMLLAGHLPYNPGPGGYAAILQNGDGLVGYDGLQLVS